MSWNVEYTDEFGLWWESLSEDEQIALDASVQLLERFGPQLRFPHSSHIENSKHGGMRELRTQCQGHPLRSLYIFDPRRIAILLIGGDKSGDDDWYEKFVPKADKIYDQHLAELKEE